MSSPAPRLGAMVLVLASLGAGIATIAAAPNPAPAPQTQAPVAATVTTIVAAPPTTPPAPAPAPEPSAPGPSTARATTAPTTPPPSQATATPAPPPPGPPSPAPAPPEPAPPVIVAQSAEPTTIKLRGCGDARSTITVRLAAPATAVTLHVTGPGGATRSRAMSGGGTSWTDTLGPYEVTGTATWSMTAHNDAGITRGALKTVRVVAC